MVMNAEQETTDEELLVAYFKSPSQYLPGKNEDMTKHLRQDSQFLEWDSNTGPPA